jgi:hypothetical protein
VNVDRRWLGTSGIRVPGIRVPVVRVRGLAAALVLLAAGCMLLGWGSGSRHLTAAAAAAEPSQDSASASFLASAPTAPTPSASAGSAAGARARSLLAGLPLRFEPNQGQANLNAEDSRAKFVARGSGYSLLLGSEGAILNLSSRVPESAAASKGKPGVLDRVESLRMRLAGSNPEAVLTASDALSSTSNYILGNDPAKWRHNVPQFARVSYENIYPGINLAFYGNQGRLEYDFQVAPGANPAQAELEFDGANRLQLRSGALVIEAQGGAVRLDAPRVYQQINGRQQPVEGSFVLHAGNRAGFAIGPYDHSRELIIDPILTYSTYFGGTGDEHFSQVAVDSAGNIYLAGSTTSTNLPTVTGVYQPALNGTQNVYVAKINPTQGANGLVYVTYLGGSGVDYPVGVAVDGGGNAYVAGTTTSANFPVTPTTAYQTAPEPASTGPRHVFVTELNDINGVATALQYSTYLSGNGDDIASGMTIDARGFVYVTGTTTSSDAGSTTDQFPASTVPQGLPFQNFPRGPIQFFVTKVNTTAPKIGSIAYSTYFGGGTTATSTTPIATGGGITVDVNGNIYFSGTTNYTYSGTSGTTDFPILNAYQPCLDQPPPTIVINPPVCTSTSTTANSDAFVAKLNPTASQGVQLQWSSYVGGSGSDSSTGVAVDPVGATNVYITGTTNSPDVTTLSTFAAYQICLDTPVNPSAGTACPSITASPVPTDAFVARLTNPATGAATTNMTLTYFSYLGGSANDEGLALTVDSANGALMTGWTQSTDFPVFPTPNAVQSHLNGPQNAFVARLNTAATLTNTASWSNPFGGNNTDQGTSITLDTNQNVFVAGDTNSSSLLQLNKPYEGYQGGFDAFLTELGPAGGLSISGSLTLGTNQVYVSAGNQATFSYVLTNQGPDLLSNITVSDDISPINTGVALTYVSASVTSGTCSGGSTSTVVSCLIPSLQAFSTATVTVVLTPTPANGGTAQFNGGTVTANSPNNVTPATVTVTAKMSDFNLSVSPTSQAVPVAGDTATYQVTLTPNPIYGTNIGLACSGLPPGSTCAFSATSVSLPTSSPASPTLNITTTARPIPLPTSSLFTRHFYALWLPVPGLALLGVGFGGSRRRRRMLGMLMLCAVFGLILLQPACSSTSTQPPVSGTPAGTYTITVAATSGSDTKSFPIQLTVP